MNYTKNEYEETNVYLISDIHFGVRNFSYEWLNNQLDYFNNFFIPTVSKDAVKNKYLIIPGDVFDNRQTINILIYNKVLDLFKRLSDVFSHIYVITGNHDITNKNSNDINSLVVLDLIDNITIFKETTVASIGNKWFLFVPWCEHNEIQEIQKHPDCDYLIIHSDINGLSFNKYSKINDGLDTITLRNFKYVFSGHIHYSQEKDNVIMLGCPYHMNRNDLNNDKFIYRLNVNTNELSKIKNDYSPEFKEIDFYDLIEYTRSSASNLFRNNYVYLNVDSALTFENTLNMILQDINTARNIKIVHYQRTVSTQNELVSTDKITLGDIMNEYIDNLKHDEETVSLVRNIVNSYKKELNITNL